MTKLPDSELGPLFADHSQPPKEAKAPTGAPPITANLNRILTPEELSARFAALRKKLEQKSGSAGRNDAQPQRREGEETPEETLTKLGGKITRLSWPTEREMNGDEVGGWIRGPRRETDIVSYETVKSVIDLAKQPGWVMVELADDATVGFCHYQPGEVVRMWRFKKAGLPTELQQWK